MSKLGQFVPQPKKEAPPGAEAPQKPATPPGEELVALTFRLPRASWLDLKVLSATLKRPISSLVIEGLGLVAEHHGHTFEVPDRDKPE